MKTEKKTKKLVLSALFLALAYLLPYVTGQIREIGAMLCPMHLPILLCGFICGPIYGLAVGFTAPLFRSLTLGMPKLFPSAVCMSFELMTYGALAGLFYRILPRKRGFLYISLILAMLAGRLVWGAASFAAYGVQGGRFTLTAFLAGAVTNAIPGIILQILLIPPLVMILERKSKENFTF